MSDLDTAPLVPGLNAKTYEIEKLDGKRFRLTVPATYRVTFGAIVPGAAKETAVHGTYGWGLRFWSDEKHQHAVFSGISSFRDMSLPMEVAAVRKFGSEDWYLDEGLDPAGTVEQGWRPIGEIKQRVEELKEPEEDAPWVAKTSRYAIGKARS